MTHAVCGAQLGRDLAAAGEVAGHGDWADSRDRLLAEMNRTAIAARPLNSGYPADPLLATYRRGYDNPITARLGSQPEHHRARRGKTRRPEHVNLLDTHRDEVLRYATTSTFPSRTAPASKTRDPPRSA